MKHKQLDYQERVALLRGIFFFQIIILFFQVWVLILVSNEWMV